HVQWTFIDEIAAATVDAGHPPSSSSSPSLPALPAPPAFSAYPADMILRRRSALAFDGQYGLDAARFFAMLSRTLPSAAPPWDALWWTPRIHLALFVHRVEDVEPGLYLLARSAAAVERLRAACRGDFLWQRAHEPLPLYVLARGDCRRIAERVSCDQ